MKKILFYVLISFFTPKGWAAVSSCNDEGKVYKFCQDQSKLYGSAVEKAKASGKNVVVVIGAEWCPWCHSLHRMLQGNELGKSISEKYELVDVAVYKDKDKLPSGQRVLSELQKKAGLQGKIDGLPMLAVVNPINGKAVMINTEPLEKNTATTKGHDPKKVSEELARASEAVK